MAFSGKSILNPANGQKITFKTTASDSRGELLEMESEYPAGSLEPPPHYHPFQEEEFTVISGHLSVRIYGAVQRLQQGDKLIIAAGQVHSMWNHSDGITEVNWKVRPAMETEYFLENAVGLIQAGGTNSAGMPGLLQKALLAQKFSHVFRLASPPYFIQKMAFALLAPIARMRGLKGSYDEYID